MPKKIPRPQAAITPELKAHLAAIEARNAQTRPRRPGTFDLDAYVDDMIAGRSDRPGIVRAGDRLSTLAAAPGIPSAEPKDTQQ